MNTRLPRLEAVCRYFVCLLMLVYGLVKLFHGQFYTDEYWKDLALGQLTGFQLTWAFHSHSQIYETILGLVEVVVGLLVFFPRTTRLGVLLFLPVMTNLVLINTFFSIGALPSAGALWLAGVILLLLHFPRLRRDLWDRAERKPAARLLPQAAVIFLGCALAGVILYNNKLRFHPDPQIRGTWDLASQHLRLYFEKGKTCVIKDAGGQLHFASYRTDDNRTITVSDDDSLLSWAQSPYRIVSGALAVTTKSGEQILAKRK